MKPLPWPIYTHLASFGVKCDIQEALLPFWLGKVKQGQESVKEDVPLDCDTFL